VHSILIGVDESERSEDAIAFGRRLAGISSAPIGVVCAFPYNAYPARAGNAVYRDYLRDDAAKTANRMRESLGIENAFVRLIAEPSAARALDRAAERDQAAMIVVGSTHTSRRGRVLPGATGERLLHGSPCAVAVVPDGYRTQDAEPIRRIGLAYDGSPEADLALAAAVELARVFHAALAIVSVVDPRLSTTSPMLGTEDYHRAGEEAEEAMDDRLTSVAAELSADIPARTVRLTGDPAERLVEYSTGLDLLVLGSRRYGPARAVFAGGVSGRVIRNAHCPVIVVPRGAETPLGTLFDSAATV
jgi:nucleotide-binding universal stress UspA family protein